VFLHLHSPGTVANLTTNPSMEINVVDPIIRKGYRFKGQACVVADGELFDRILDFYAERGVDPARVQAAVLMHVQTAALLISPAYDTGASEAEVTAQWRAHHLALHPTVIPDDTT